MPLPKYPLVLPEERELHSLSAFMLFGQKGPQSNSIIASISSFQPSEPHCQVLVCCFLWQFYHFAIGESFVPPSFSILNVSQLLCSCFFSLLLLNPKNFQLSSHWGQIYCCSCCSHQIGDHQCYFRCSHCMSISKAYLPMAMKSELLPSRDTFYFLESHY